MLKLDDEFKESYCKYYGKMAPHEIMDNINESAMGYSGFNLVQCTNVVKTCAVLSYTYLDYYAEAAKKASFRVSNMDKFIFDTAFNYMYHAHPDVLQSFLGIRLIVRDIYKELALDMYGKSDTETIEKIKAVKTENTYSIQIPNPKTRDEWFYNMAISVGSYSKCHSRKIGAILVKDKSLISTGYNGPPRGVPTCDQRWFIDKTFYQKYNKHIVGRKAEDIKGVCPRRIIGFPSGQGLDVCPAGHAERNALINAARHGIKTKNTSLYMTCGVPCSACMVEIINSGVKEIICTAVDWYDETTKYLLENSDVKIRFFDFLI